ncbi:MAG: hypothetical protein AAB403_05655 [Planctomycetota bacterium]
MDTRIDRTLAIAAILFAVVALWQRTPVVFGQTSSSQVQSVTGSATGRYQLIINPQMRRDTFLLDSATGRIWTKVKYTDLKGEPEVWQPDDRVNSDQEFLAWAQRLKQQ